MKIYNPTNGDFPAIAIRIGNYGIGCGFDNRWKKGERKCFKVLMNVFLNDNYTIWLFYRIVIGLRIFDK